jgi:hypothetical protein
MLYSLTKGAMYEIARTRLTRGPHPLSGFGPHLLIVQLATPPPNGIVLLQRSGTALLPLIALHPLTDDLPLPTAALLLLTVTVHLVPLPPNALGPPRVILTLHLVTPNATKPLLPPVPPLLYDQIPRPLTATAHPGRRPRNGEDLRIHPRLAHTELRTDTHQPQMDMLQASPRAESARGQYLESIPLPHPTSHIRKVVSTNIPFCHASFISSI